MSLRSLRLRSSLVLALVVGLAVASTGRAAAQDGGGASTPPAAPSAPSSTTPPAPPPSTPPPAVDQPPAPPGSPRGGAVVTYHSPMRPTCEDELSKDRDWFDNLTTRLSNKINRDAATHYAIKNNEHVIAAYAVFWVFTVGFVLMMWRRQRALQAELARLEKDLARALKEGGAA